MSASTLYETGAPPSEEAVEEDAAANERTLLDRDDACPIAVTPLPGYGTE